MNYQKVIIKKKEGKQKINRAHYHLEVQANQKKIVQKENDAFLPTMGETGLSHDIF